MYVSQRLASMELDPADLVVSVALAYVTFVNLNTGEKVLLSRSARKHLDG